MSISETLQKHIETLQFFDDSIDDYIYIYDLTEGRVFLTDKFREKYPIPPAGEDGNDFNDWNDIVYAKDRELMDHYRDLLIQQKIQSFDIDYRILDRQNNKVWVRVKGTLREKDDAQSLLLVGRISEIASSGVVDNVTGLFGMEKFMEDMKQNMELYDGYLMVLGIDNFQNINLTQGRAFGDTVLKSVADALDANTRYPMEIYRLNSDCFAVNFIQQQKEDIERFYEAIRTALKQLCTVSAGVVYYKHKDEMDSDSMYLYAETALVQAKKEGKDRMVFLSEDDYQKNLEQVKLLAEMKTCILEDCRGFSLDYQPQVHIQDFSLYGAEALLRYESPSKGRMSPIEFIPLLEQTGLICHVGEWVLRTAVTQCKQWRKHIPHMHISVNMSYVQLEQNGITDIVLHILEEAGLPGNALTLEMTESIQLQNYHYFNKIFYVWKQHGIRISIDDFGTGYSSLSYLKSIEINEVKIDRCFVNHVQYNAYNFRLLSNMIELAHTANIEVCCEGVETIEELMALQELHPDILQGYFFAKPYTVEMFERIYIDTNTREYKTRKQKEANLCRTKFPESKAFLEECRHEEIGNITENMDEMVYVSDLETYELYYLNATGRRMTGVYDYKGYKCYKVLQGKDAPCEFCNNTKLCQEQFLVWEMENKFLEKHFILKDKLIPWNGKLARVEMAIDITEKELLSKSIQKRLHFEKAVANACTLLFGQENTETALYQALNIIGEFAESKRAYLLEPNHEKQLWKLHTQWLAEEHTPAEDMIFSMNNTQVYALQQKNMIVPITYMDNILGLLCVEQPQYQERTKELMTAIANFIGYMMVNIQHRKVLDMLLDGQSTYISSL